jgi:four helix bundle protein
MMAFRFEKLEVWHKAIQFAQLIYEVTKTFPADERFGLTNQMRRAAVSVSSNIAEGTSRTTSKDKSRFVEIAYGSLLEVVSQAHIAEAQSMLTVDEFARVQHLADDTARMLSGLRKSLEDK